MSKSVALCDTKPSRSTFCTDSNSGASKRLSKSTPPGAGKYPNRGRQRAGEVDGNGDVDGLADGWSYPRGVDTMSVSTRAPQCSAAGSVVAVRGSGASGTLALTAQEFAGVQAGVRAWREREVGLRRELSRERGQARSRRLQVLCRCMEAWKMAATRGRRRLVSRFLVEGVQAFG